MGQRRQQVHLPAVGTDRAAWRFAVHRHRLGPLARHHRLLLRQPAAHTRSSAPASTCCRVRRSVGARIRRLPASELPKTATHTHAYAESNGFLTLLSDGERLTGPYALGPEAGEWIQQATLAIRAHVPLEVLSDTIQPFPSFSGIYDAALKALRMEIADMPRPVRPVDAQMASLSG